MTFCVVGAFCVFVVSCFSLFGVVFVVFFAYVVWRGVFCCGILLMFGVGFMVVLGDVFVVVCCWGVCIASSPK